MAYLQEDNQYQLQQTESISFEIQIQFNLFHFGIDLNFELPPTPTVFDRCAEAVSFSSKKRKITKIFPSFMEKLTSNITPAVESCQCIELGLLVNVETIEEWPNMGNVFLVWEKIRTRSIF